MTDALIAAAKNGDHQILRELVASGADLERCDSQGWTPLLYASNRGDLIAIEMLIAAGADVNHGADMNLDPGSETGLTAILLAELGEYSRAVNMLLAAGAKPSPFEGFPFGCCSLCSDREKLEALWKDLEQAMQERGEKLS